MKNQNSKTVPFFTILFPGLWICLLASCTRTIYEPAVRSEKIVDTILRTVPDSAVLRALFECDSLGNVRLTELYDAKGKMAAMETQLKGGELTVVTKWQIRYVDRVREVHDTTTVVEVREVTRVVKHVPKFFWWCFGIALAAVCFGGWRLVRKFL